MWVICFEFLLNKFVQFKQYYFVEKIDKFKKKQVIRHILKQKGLTDQFWTESQKL